MSLAILLLIVISILMSIVLINTTSEYILDVLAGRYNVYSIIIIAGILILDYIWIRMLIYIYPIVFYGVYSVIGKHITL